MQILDQVTKILLIGVLFKRLNQYFQKKGVKTGADVIPVEI